MENVEDTRQNRLATQVGWPAFKRARRLKKSTRGNSAEGTSRTCQHSRTREGKSEIEFKEDANDDRLSCDTEVMTPRGQPVGVDGRERCPSKTRRRPTTRLDLRSARRKNSSALARCLTLSFLVLQLVSNLQDGILQDLLSPGASLRFAPNQAGPSTGVRASLIIGDSAIEIQEVDPNANTHTPQQQQQQLNPSTDSHENSGDKNQEQQRQQQSSPEQQQQQQQHGPDPMEPSVILGSSSGQQQELRDHDQEKSLDSSQARRPEASRLPSGPLPPLGKPGEDITDGDHKSRNNHDYDLNDLSARDREHEKEALSEVILGTRKSPLGDSGSSPDKTITGAVVDFELQPAGGHNKAKIKKKKKKKKMEKKEEEAFKKWGKKKKMEKKAMEKAEKKHMKKKKEEGKKKKKKWGMEEHGQKKKGNFKKKKWGKKVKKGKGVKKGKKGKKFLKDKGHKNTGFKTVYHKEEWGKSAKWHDIKREKKWDEKSKKWKKKWNKEKGKKYKGDHMKKFEKKKKEGKKYKKAKKEKYKKFKKEEFEKGKKKKMEEHKKKKEGGMKKEEMKKEMKKKKKKKKP